MPRKFIEDRNPHGGTVHPLIPPAGLAREAAPLISANSHGFLKGIYKIFKEAGTE